MTFIFCTVFSTPKNKDLFLKWKVGAGRLRKLPLRLDFWEVKGKKKKMGPGEEVKHEVDLGIETFLV